MHQLDHVTSVMFDRKYSTRIVSFFVYTKTGGFINKVIFKLIPLKVLNDLFENFYSIL